MVTKVSGTSGVDKVKDGAVGTAALAEGATTPPKSSGFPFTKEYVSPPQTISSGGTLTLPHGLGAIPKFHILEFVCVSAQSGYVAGDVISVFDDQTTVGSASSRGATIQKTSTDLIVTYGGATNVFQGQVKGTGASFALTNANWNLVVRAWA